MTTTYDDLAAKAEAATPGPWNYKWGVVSDGVILTLDEHGNPKRWLFSPHWDDEQGKADNAFVCAASPAVILSLIADLREALGEVERNNNYLQNLLRHYWPCITTFGELDLTVTQIDNGLTELAILRAEVERLKTGAYHVEATANMVQARAELATLRARVAELGG